MTDKEEAELVDFLLRCASIGYPKTRKQALAIVQRPLDSRNAQHTVTDGWWASFCRRHPVLSLRTPAPLSRARAAASNSESIERYFDLLEETLDVYRLRERPHLIFNMDETGMPLNPKPPKVIASSKARTVTSTSSGDKTQQTIVGCVSAGGRAMPPMVIWDRKSITPTHAKGEVGGTTYAFSSKGWMDSVIFDGWFANHFLRWLPMDRPILLLLDGHSSHFCPETLRNAAEQEIIVFALPPNTTHLSQPLDKGCFGPLKMRWRQVCHKYMSENPGKIVTRYSFSELFAEAWNDSMIPCNILSGFSTTGIFPVNRNALLKRLNDFENVPQLAASSKLPFMPMSSPSGPM